tara:strand:+ start:3805 stop:5031 length:1227 start_codon:yes stop_codon:yes gene_type:complete
MGVLFSQCPTASARIWGDAEGKLKVEAELVKTEGGDALLKEKDGRVFRVPFSFLRTEDQQFIQQWIQKQSIQKAASPYAAEAKLNEAFALEVTPTKKVNTEFSIKVTTPQLKAKEWIVFASAPPQTAGQKVTASLVPQGTTVRDLNSFTRSVMMARIPARGASQEQSITPRVIIEAELFARKLVSRSGQAKPAEPLSRIDRASFLRETSLIDHGSEAFQQWLQVQGLERNKGESQIGYARRTFLHVRQSFSYDYRAEMNRLGSHICEAGQSDCGGLAIVFVSALRAYDIPARLLAGRWAKSSEEGARLKGVDYHRQHVKAEFYADGVGWVPVDLTTGDLPDKDTEGLRYFGNDLGDFVTLHFDHGLKVDTIHFGEAEVKWMQSTRYWVTGSGSLDGSTTVKTWVVVER